MRQLFRISLPKGCVAERRRGAMVTAMDWLAKSNFSLVSLIETVMVIVAAFIAVTFINRFMAGSIRGLEQRLSLPEETLLGFTRVMKVIVWLIAALLILSLWGVKVSGLWTLLVTTATIIGVGFLAVWAMISNVTANLFITIWRPFQLGDTVELLPENLKGRVIVRNLMFTVLREENGARLHVPNNLFFQKIFRVSQAERRS
jgi:small-conductance mechanosensitive channel